MFLAVSHIVYSAPDALEALKDFERAGYAVKHGTDAMPNLAPKRDFLSRPLPDSTTVRMVARERHPMVEIIAENFEGAVSPYEPSPSFTGDLFGNTGEGDGLPTIQISVSSVRSAIELWSALCPERISKLSDRTDVIFKGGPAGPALRLRYIAERASDDPVWLDQFGIVCLAFACRDVDALRKLLVSRNYEVSECFDLQPFDHPLRVLFVRNRTGEIYEFVSLRISGRANDA